VNRRATSKRVREANVAFIGISCAELDADLRNGLTSKEQYDRI